MTAREWLRHTGRQHMNRETARVTVTSSQSHSHRHKAGQRRCQHQQGLKPQLTVVGAHPRRASSGNSKESCSHKQRGMQAGARQA